MTEQGNMQGDINDILSNRLNRLENKIDRLADAMTALAKTEEKLLVLEEDRKLVTARMNRLSEKLDVLQKDVIKNTSFSDVLSRAGWLILAAAVGAVFVELFGAYI